MGKKLLVTGGSGFIGSAFVRHTIKNGHEVVNVDAMTYAASLESTKEVNDCSNYSFIKLDIRDRNGINELLQRTQPDAVVHFAAESHVDRSIDTPSDFIQTNIIGTYNLLDAATNYLSKTKNEKFRFLHVSTDEVYGSLSLDPKLLFTEETKYDPRSPYSASKAASDHLVRAWGSTYDLPTLITNCSNNYGPFQFPEKLIPKTISCALAGEPIKIYGDGKNIRDWLFVDDHVSAVYSVLNNGEIGSTYNVGGNNELSNIDLVTRICDLMTEISPHSEIDYHSLITFVRDRPGHDRRYAINSSKIQRELNWQPEYTLNTGLRKTVDWYLKNQNWWKPLIELDK